MPLLHAAILGRSEKLREESRALRDAAKLVVAEAKQAVAVARSTAARIKRPEKSKLR